jgi:hypothetical protein
MKKILNYLLIASFLLAGIFCFAQKPNKKATKEAEIQNLIDSQSYVFHAQQLTPLGGGTRQLTPNYDMLVKPDSIGADLPYFGRAFEAPINATDIGIKMCTRKFNYEKVNAKKGGWEITIKPTVRMDVQQMFLSISKEGYSTLQVTSLNREPITYYGYISK